MINLISRFKKKVAVKPQATRMTEYFFSPAQYEEYLNNLIFLDETGADVLYCKFDEDGGKIEIANRYFERG